MKYTNNLYGTNLDIDNNFSCIFAPTQRAGVVVLEQGEPFVQESLTRYRAARDYLVERLADFQRVEFPNQRRHSMRFSR